MKAKIAVATVSGRAYYALVNELKERGLAFLSLTPDENVPLEIEAVITTPSEQHLIKHHKVLIYEEKTDPAPVVDEAIKTLVGKKGSEALVIGVDPGKTFGIAVLSNGETLETFTCSSVEETISRVVQILDKEPKAAARILKIGNWSPSYTTELLPQFDSALPSNVTIEIVSEAGTSHFSSAAVPKRGLKHAMAATKIAERRGKVYQRKRAEEPE